MEDLFRELAASLALGVEVVAILVVSYGALEGLVGLLGGLATRTLAFERKKAIWRRFGSWLVLGLEFELAADIVRSVIAPTWMEIGELAAIAVIRTFLNYFLEKDLEKAGREGSPNG